MPLTPSRLSHKGEQAGLSLSGGGSLSSEPIHLERNHLLYAIQIVPNVSIGKSNDTDTSAIQESRASSVPLRPACMLVAV
jgi:hypothetical protein